MSGFSFTQVKLRKWRAKFIRFLFRHFDAAYADKKGLCNLKLRVYSLLNSSLDDFPMLRISQNPDHISHVTALKLLYNTVNIRQDLHAGYNCHSRITEQWVP